VTTHSLTPKLLTVLREGYSFESFRADALAGLTVAVVALPLSMALAIASGASPDKGLVTAVIAGFLISALGGSRTQVGGPTGAFVVVIFNIIAAHGYDGLLVATVLAGLILVAAGLLRLGQLIKFIPHPVITGFTAGIAVIIASSQVKDFLGLTMASVPAEFVPKWVAFFASMGTLDPATLAVGVGSLAVIVALRKVAPRLPGFLIAIVLAALAVHLLDLPVDTIGTRFPDIPSGLATGAIARTATNIRAGARTPVAGMMHAVFLLLFVLFGTDLMAYVPMAALAAILFLVAWGMSEYERFLVLLRMPNSDRAVLLITFGLTVLVDLTVAIGVGVTLASLLFMARMAESVAVDISGARDPDLDSEDAAQREELPEGVEVFRITGPFFFGVAGELLDTLRRLGQRPKVIILRLRLVPLLDASGARALEEFVSQAKLAGVEIVMSGVQPQPMAVLERLDLGARTFKVHHAPDFESALEIARKLAI